MTYNVVHTLVRSIDAPSCTLLIIAMGDDLEDDFDIDFLAEQRREFQREEAQRIRDNRAVRALQPPPRSPRDASSSSAQPKKRARSSGPGSGTSSDPLDELLRWLSLKRSQTPGLEERIRAAFVPNTTEGSEQSRLASHADSAPASGSGLRLLIVSSAALRCLDLIKMLKQGTRTLPKGNVAKLFSKHMKESEQASLLAGRGCPAAGVGTPSRLLSLANAGSLNLASSALVLIDGHRDAKDFTVLTHPDCGSPGGELLGTLFREGSGVRLGWLTSEVQTKAKKKKRKSGQGEG